MDILSQLKALDLDLLSLKCQHLECDGFVRVLNYTLNENSIEHQVMRGNVLILGQEIPLHYWIDVAQYRIDYRAQQWVSKPAPNGIFLPYKYPGSTYIGREIPLATDKFIYDILTSMH